MNTFRFHRRRRTWRRFFFVTLVVAIGSLVGLIANILRVQSVVCREDPFERAWSDQSSTPIGLANPFVSSGCTPEIIAELERFIGQRILLLRLNNLERKIKQSDPSVKSIHLSRGVRERSLRASVVRRIPVVRIAVSNAFDQSLEIDDEGVVLERKSGQEALPTLVWEGFPTLRVGQKIPDHLFRAITFVRRVPAIIQTFPSTYVRSNTLEVTTIEGTLVTFSLEQDPAPQLDALQLVINQSRIDQVIYRSIDLRYERPIVTK